MMTTDPGEIRRSSTIEDTKCKNVVPGKGNSNSSGQCVSFCLVDVGIDFTPLSGEINVT